MSKAWLFRDHRQHKKLGDRCPWSVAWLEANGQRRSKKIGTKTEAQQFRRKLEGKMAAGLHQPDTRATWASFRKQYEDWLISRRKRSSTIEGVRQSFRHFERLVKPGKLSKINTLTIESYVAARSQEKTHRGLPVSPATVNLELRNIRAALRKAAKWEFIAKAPDFEMLKEDRPQPRVMPDADFAAMYKHCDAAKQPVNEHIATAEWWRALLIFARYTGWRIGEILSLRWDDVPLDPDENGDYWATTRASTNKGGRTEQVPLMPVIVQHLRRIRSFDPAVFPWGGNRRQLYPELERIAKAAGVGFPHNGRRADKFHCLRKTFGTRAAMDGIDQKSLTALMRHKSFSTTERYYLDAQSLMVNAIGKIEVSPAIQEVME